MKQIPSFFGGTRQGMAISWPARIKDKGGIRWQFHHLIDIVPTILEVTGIRAPDFVDGVAQQLAAAIRAGAQARVNQLKTQLSNQITSTLSNQLNRSFSFYDDWFDPVIGLRGRFYLNKAFFSPRKAMLADSESDPTSLCRLTPH
jgi:arylsulfatase A-like enzyme